MRESLKLKLSFWGEWIDVFDSNNVLTWIMCVWVCVCVCSRVLVCACVYISWYVCMWTDIYHHHHHHVVPPARISLTLSRHFSLSFIASGRSSGLHPVSSHSCCMYDRAGRPAFTWLYAEVHRSTSLMSSSLLLQQCPECLVRLTWIVFVMGASGRIVGVLWGVTARTCSILLSTFLCNCRLVSS